MKRFVPKVLATIGVMSLAISSAMAAEAYLVDSADLYAGPDSEYPQITTLPAGVPVTVFGCTNGWEWCDVQTSQDRGWVSGEYLQYEYQNQRVLLPSYGAQIGIPIVAFALGVYWQDHYRSRTWYGQREEWSHRSFAHRPPPRPMHAQSGPRPDQHDDHARHDEPVRHAQGPVTQRAPETRHAITNDRTHASARPVTQGAHPQPQPRSETVQHANVQHATPKPHPNPSTAVAHSNGNAERPTAAPARTARPAPPPKPQPAKPAPKREPAPNKDSDRKDDGHH
ncbi:MAG: SH3 domain-containing protein [Dokdonella sp.]